MSDDAYTRFLKLRWPPEGKPICPRCGSTKPYILGTRATFKCADCKKHFSATSGTIFAGHKLSFAQLLAFLEAKDLNALRISREAQVQYKVAWVMCSKLREMYARGGSIGDQTVAKMKGYFQHPKAPCNCSRCKRPGLPLMPATFELDRAIKGSFCPDCLNSLTGVQDEFRNNYQHLRAINQFKEELNDHKEHGRSSPISC